MNSTVSPCAGPTTPKRPPKRTVASVILSKKGPQASPGATAQGVPLIPNIIGIGDPDGFAW